MFSLEKKDLDYNWFSGTGSGGQHRNKHQNCLRLKHLPTGITVVAQRHRDRPSNERLALEKLTEMVKSYLHPVTQKERFRAKEKIRSYREPDNTVKDHASGKTFSYKDIVINVDANTIDQMITARRNAVIHK